MITIEFIVIILCLLIGTRFGGMGLGLISGIGLFILSFVFGLQPGKPPVDVMLTILAVIGCAATLQTAGGLNVMMQFAERLLRKHPSTSPFSHRLPPDVDLPLRDRSRRLYHVSHYRGYRPEKAFARNGRWRWPRWPLRWRSPPPRFRGCRFAGLDSGCAARHRSRVGILEILAVSVPASLSGVAIAALWSLRRGKPRRRY